ncbi:MAG: bifunctional phosphoglucose/phosphomannose isomerase, partial [Hymenobacteraceae bacterium]|nr:bifunctional phosphoglucose/phosphomannose isomerase [Hymenobacteraceae bacterium]MDX5394683.1 bifunctional phosphoglucose/phosphomannose isomerase [Hymenobacteraceae bacterium]MDX5510714.1 bifunctional phosphoglucose/phosphomannose isomerase [Hymenobacteraceae bacterium]
MNHNEIVGWVNPEKILKEVTVVLLRSSYDHERVQKRMDLCKPIFQEKANDVLEVRAQGQSLLAQMFYFIHLFDWVSLYLADLNGVDPNPVKVIDHLKNALAKA